MYTPKHNLKPDPAWAHEQIDSNPFAVLVTPGSGDPTATHLPLLLKRSEGALGTIYGHIALANSQARAIDSKSRALAIFSGPHAYISPAWYQTNDVPTWNYIAVHAYGVLYPLQGVELHEHLLELVERFDTQGWKISSLSPEYLRAQERAIVAFRMPIDRLEAKAKLSQNRSAQDRLGVESALSASSSATDQELASAMRAERAK